MRPIKFMLTLFMAVPLITFSQEGGKKTVQVLKSPDGFMYTNNKEGAYFCIDFKGDSLAAAGIENAFNIDGRILQVVVNPFTTKEYTHNQDSAREIALLKSKMESELDYISNEVMKKRLASGFEIFKNHDGKNYLLWYYDNPGPRPADTSVTPLATQYFLTFVSNQHVVGVATPVFEGENKDECKQLLKQLADRIDVFGSRIDVDAMYYKLDAQSDGKELQYADSANKYTLTIPEWLNITESPAGNVFIATLPDIDNIQNAIMVRNYKKADYKSLEAFNENFFPKDLKMGDKFSGGLFLLKKELEKPPGVTGISTKISFQRGPALYESRFLTMETGNSYLLVAFTATPGTFKINQPRFLEFVKKIEILQ